ncbi:MAG: hypothetical protein J6W75_00995 [Bacteroidaceae bacterium]|nr:hypothetical protein [Bacteroidales bacterium]MBP5769926.1 hypothetical protein [Bacteroidaceae bacterium]
MKKYVLLASAILAFASCANDSFTGSEEDARLAQGEKAISFGFDVPNATRAGGATAATALDNQFIVWGEKNESGGAAVAVPSTNSVFPNYQVNWVNLPHSTTSNTNGWEYVGYTHSNTSSTDDYQTNISPSLGVAQSIKYWDMNATNYVFTAVSALKNDIKTGKVQITKTNTAVSTKYLKGYQIVTTADADFEHLYFSDRIEMAPGTNPVTLNFRNVLAHIRVGIYETIPGYDVTAIKFYQTDGSTEFTTGSSAESIFGATVDNLKPGANTLTITYNDGSVNSTLENRPVVATSGARATTITLGQNFNTLSTSTIMAVTSAEPTWDNTSGAYTSVFPREGVTTDLTLKVKYTLYNQNSGETMDITGTAVVPGEYLQWKPNFKYTYIFKLTDDDLTPITFDAVQIETETGSIDFITTVDVPSITTYQNGTQVTSSNEYVASKPVYVVVNDGVALTVGTDAKLYTATVDPGFVEGITEASVANALANGEDGTGGSKVLTDASSNKLTVTPTASGTLTAFTSIAKEDSPTGETLTINGAKFTPTAGTIYVFEYKDSSDNLHYKVIKIAS